MEWTKIQLLVGTVDYTSYLANQEQTVTMPDGPEIGRASFVLFDSGGMGSISDWSSITLKGGGTSATVNLWSGYVTRQQTEPFTYQGGSARYVTLDCQSAAIKLLTNEPVTEQYGGGNNESTTTDRDIVADLINTYAPALYNVDKIGTANPVDIDYIAFNNETLRSALNKLNQRTMVPFGVDAAPEFWYKRQDLEKYTTAYGYRLKDDTTLADKLGYTYLYMNVKPVYDRDATELRNSIRVIGGETLSRPQEETFTGDDVTTVFQVDYPPDVIISVVYNGAPQTVGIYFVDDPADFDCLVEYDRRQFHFNAAPESGKDVVITYRYKTRVDVTYQDATSIAAVGTIWAPVLEDSSISSAAQGSAFGSVYLASTQAVERAQVSTREGGTVGTVLPWEPGGIVKVTVGAFGWTNKDMTIRGVTVRAQSRPGGNGSCLIIWDLDLGTPTSAGRYFGNQWNNDRVTPQNHAPRYGNF